MNRSSQQNIQIFVKLKFGGIKIFSENRQIEIWVEYQNLQNKHSRFRGNKSKSHRILLIEAYMTEPHIK